jgi:hypothetical protein
LPERTNSQPPNFCTAKLTAAKRMIATCTRQTLMLNAERRAIICAVLSRVQR